MRANASFSPPLCFWTNESGANGGGLKEVNSPSLSFSLSLSQRTRKNALFPGFESWGGGDPLSRRGGGEFQIRRLRSRFERFFHPPISLQVLSTFPTNSLVGSKVLTPLSLSLLIPISLPSSFFSFFFLFLIVKEEKKFFPCLVQHDGFLTNNKTNTFYIISIERKEICKSFNIEIFARENRVAFHGASIVENLERGESWKRNGGGRGRRRIWKGRDFHCK